MKLVPTNIDCLYLVMGDSLVEP